MRKILPALFLCICLFLTTSMQSFAAQNTYVAPPTNVSASIGTFTLSVSGMIAPFASVVLIVDDIVLRSTVADTNGYFSISSVLINKGITSFCLDAIDVKRLGESYTCFDIPPAAGPVERNNLFLPPTLGLQVSEVNTGDNAVAWGYSMRNASVTVHLSDGRTFVVKADADGFYQVTFKTLTSGTLELYADAVYQGQQSLKPTRNVPLLVLSASQQFQKAGKNILQKIWEFLINNPIGVLWISIPIFILILILLKKLKPEWFTYLDKTEDSLAAHLPFIHRKLHHSWFVGY